MSKSKLIVGYSSLAWQQKSDANLRNINREEISVKIAFLTSEYYIRTSKVIL